MNMQKKYLKHKTLRTHKGFTLLEMLIAISIFALVMSSTVHIFSRLVVAKVEFDSVRVSHERAQSAIDSIVKSVRSGVVMVPDISEANSDDIIFYDYFQSACIRYAFDNDGSKEITRYSKDLPLEDKENCNAGYFSGVSGEVITAGSVTGNFAYTKANDDSEVGLVRVVMEVEDPNGQESNPTRMQMTISVRNPE
jgi:prepilin-type N-terminal cleavage/methylation domain-containing protein